MNLSEVTKISERHVRRTLEKVEAERVETLERKETKKALAMKALLDGATIEEAAKETGLNRLQVIRVETELQAKRQHGILTSSYLEGRKELLPKVLHCGLNLIANAFQHAMDKGEALDLKEAEIVSRIIANVDHIARLDAGDPTQIVDINRTIPATFKDMVAAFNKDPFIDTQLLIEEIKHNESNESGSEGTTSNDNNESD